MMTFVPAEYPSRSTKLCADAAFISEPQMAPTSTSTKLNDDFTRLCPPRPQSRFLRGGSAAHCAKALASAPPGSCCREPVATPPAPSRLPTVPESCLREGSLLRRCLVSPG